MESSWKEGSLSFIENSTVLLFFIMLVLLMLFLVLVVMLMVVIVLVVMMMLLFLLLLILLLLLVLLLLLLLLLLTYYEENNIAYSNGVLAVDGGKLDTELTFSCNIRSTTTSINNYIYSTPAVQAEDNGFYNSQLVL